MGGEYFDILILAMVAVFVLYRLRGVLGRRTGNERQRPDPFASRAEAAAKKNQKVVALPERRAK